MKEKICLGFLAGALATVAVMWQVALPQARDHYWALGLNEGRIITQAEIAEMIRTELGSDLRPAETGAPFFDVKSTSVVVVERDGTKTLRSIR
ncbi:MAG: hypothetical protein R3F15_11290 [Lysobacterales bacterium]